MKPIWLLIFPLIKELVKLVIKLYHYLLKEMKKFICITFRFNCNKWKNNSNGNFKLLSLPKIEFLDNMFIKCNKKIGWYDDIMI